MQRYWSLPALGCAFIVVLGIMGAGGSGAAARTGAARSAAPLVDCTVETLTLGLTLQGSVAATRPFTNTAGDSFIQFASVPFTTTGCVHHRPGPGPWLQWHSERYIDRQRGECAAEWCVGDSLRRAGAQSARL